MSLKFLKSDILRSRKTIEKLFAEGQTLKAYPLRLVYIATDEEGVPCQVLFAISKRNIRRAVKRNLVRRRLREIWRKQLPELTTWLAERGGSLAIALTYSDKEPATYAELEAKVKVLITKLRTTLDATAPQTGSE